MYEALYKPNQLIYGEHEHIAIVTGWTPIKQVAKLLDENDYAVIGQLYSAKRGINFLIRNLLWNPQINTLVILNATKEDKNAGACQCLLDFFNYGFNWDEDIKKWKIDRIVEGYIDGEIPESVLDDLSDSLNVVEYNSLDELEYRFGNVLKISEYSLNPDSVWFSGRTEKQKFPVNDPCTKIFPSQIYGQQVTGKNIAETWVKIIHRIRNFGVLRPTGYDGQWQELQVLTAVVTDEPEDFYFPEPNYLPIDRDGLENYIPQILNDAPYQAGVKYTYGQRLRSWFGQDQIEAAIAKLIKEPDAASAVMNLWDSGSGGGEESLARFGRSPGDSDHDHSGSPCLNHIWVRIADNVLTLTATFRSNDMFSAWPSNAMGLRALQKYILEQINTKGGYDFQLGALITVSDSAHIYDDCWENADNLIKSTYYKIMNNRDYFDPAGNFNVWIEDGLINVEWLASDGDLLKIYRDRKSIKLRQAIAIDCPTLSLENALYLGDRLHHAEAQLSS